MHVSELESRLLGLLEARGLINEAARMALDEPADLDPPTSVWGPKIQRIIDENLISRQAVEALVEELLRGNVPADDPLGMSGSDFTFQEITFPGVIPAPTHLAHRYRDLSLVGFGGSGRVYRAYDNLLQRPVALKFLRWDKPSVRHQLLKEARAQAKVKHPNVREVFEVADMDGQAFITMRWVESGALQQVAAKLSLMEKVRLMMDVCEGVHAAHSQDLLHLDLKPGNILVEKTSEGKWRPLVTDFGLVLDQEASGPQRLHGVGTPPYASPEQVQQDFGRLGPRSDVYSLGVTLHVLITGKLPYEDLPRPPRGGPSSLELYPFDLLRISRKAMALQPLERYPNARSLGEDLGRFLNGNPIQARRHTWLYVTRLWVQRNRHLAMLAASTILLLVGAAAWGLQNRLKEKRHAILAQRFGQELQEVVALVRFSKLSPPHDRSPEMKEIRDRMDGIQSDIEKMGPGAKGTGLAALGRAHLALDEREDALRCFDQAWEVGERSPEVARDLGLLKGLAYLHAFDSAEPRLPATRSQEELKTLLKDPALKLLKEARNSAPRKDLPDPSDVLIALLEGRDQDGLELGLRALDSPDPHPWQYESWLLLMEIWDTRSSTLIGKSKVNEGKRILNLFEKALDRTILIGRSDPGLRTMYGFLKFDQAYLLEQENASPEAELIAAIESFKVAHQIDPSTSAPVRWQADGLRRLAEALRKQGRDPLPVLTEAEQLIRPVVKEISPGVFKSRLVLARVLMQRGAYLSDRGQDATQVLEEAETLMHGLEQEPSTRMDVPSQLLVLNAVQCQYSMRQGLSPLDHLRSLSGLLGTQKADPRDRGPYSEIHLLWRLRAQLEQSPLRTLPGMPEGIRQFRQRLQAFAG